MLYLSGVKNAAIASDLADGTIGFLKTPAVGNSLDGVKIWAIDNGAFSGRYPGDEAYLQFLDKHRDRQPDCLFVAVPDVLGDALATLALFPAMSARIRKEGWPVALVGQDGMEALDVPWDDVDWLFVGGSTEWKLGMGATTLIREAQRQGKKVHIGRVNSARRFRLFAGMGCDSADGTYLAFGPGTNAPKLRAWIDQPHSGVLF